MNSLTILSLILFALLLFSPLILWFTHKFTIGRATTCVLVLFVGVFLTQLGGLKYQAKTDFASDANYGKIRQYTQKEGFTKTVTFKHDGDKYLVFVKGHAADTAQNLEQGGIVKSSGDYKIIQVKDGSPKTVKETPKHVEDVKVQSIAQVADNF